MNKSPKDMRREYASAQLSRDMLRDNPLELFAQWFEQAIALELLDATAMVLSTVSQAGQPSARIVLLKSYDQNGFIFFSDYGSRKGQDISQQAQVCLLFHWRELDRQIRIYGRAKPIDTTQSLEYFRSRPRASQVSAAISQQSQPVDSRQTLQSAYVALDASGQDIEKPDRWGGYCVQAETYEFWQGREGRLHDRFQYEREGRDGWHITRLQP